MGLFSSKKQTVPATGFYSQPAAYQQLYNSVLGNTNSLLPGITPEMFQSAPLSEGGQAGLNALYGGFTPDANQIKSDVAMLQNPFDENVIGTINREATGQNSLVNQFASRAGQQGSNRSFLGSSDVEQNRLNNIGNFKQSQYNNAINASLGALTNSRRADALGAYDAGNMERGIATQDQMAPLNAIMAQQNALSGVPTQFGNFGNQAYTIKTGGGLGGLLGGLGAVTGGLGQLGGVLGGLGGIANQAGYGGLGSSLGGWGSALSFFSDKELKENIVPRGTQNGHKIYEFNYKDNPNRKYIGVIAQDVQKTHPEAVKEINGYLAVDYGKIGVDLQEVE